MAGLFIQTGIEHLPWVIIKLLGALGTQKEKGAQSPSLGPQAGGGHGTEAGRQGPSGGVMTGEFWRMPNSM